MKRANIIIAIFASLAITACGNDSSKGTALQSSPGEVAESIFAAAKTGDYGGLPKLIDAEADGDSKRIAAVASDQGAEAEFKKYFEKGKLNGEPVIDGDKASVKILFGPDGDKEETFEMVKKDGNWYLKSF